MASIPYVPDDVLKRRQAVQRMPDMTVQAPQQLPDMAVQATPPQGSEAEAQRAAGMYGSVNAALRGRLDEATAPIRSAYHAVVDPVRSAYNTAREYAPSAVRAAGASMAAVSPAYALDAYERGAAMDRALAPQRIQNEVLARKPQIGVPTAAPVQDLPYQRPQLGPVLTREQRVDSLVPEGVTQLDAQTSGEAAGIPGAVPVYETRGKFGERYFSDNQYAGLADRLPKGSPEQLKYADLARRKSDVIAARTKEREQAAAKAAYEAQLAPRNAKEVADLAKARATANKDTAAANLTKAQTEKLHNTGPQDVTKNTQALIAGDPFQQTYAAQVAQGVNPDRAAIEAARQAKLAGVDPSNAKYAPAARRGAALVRQNVLSLINSNGAAPGATLYGFNAHHGDVRDPNTPLSAFSLRKNAFGVPILVGPPNPETGDRNERFISDKDYLQLAPFLGSPAIERK